MKSKWRKALKTIMLSMLLASFILPGSSASAGEFPFHIEIYYDGPQGRQYDLTVTYGEAETIRLHDIVTVQILEDYPSNLNVQYGYANANGMTEVADVSPDGLITIKGPGIIKVLCTDTSQYVNVVSNPFHLTVLPVVEEIHGWIYFSTEKEIFSYPWIMNAWIDEGYGCVKLGELQAGATVTVDGWTVNASGETWYHIVSSDIPGDISGWVQGTNASGQPLGMSGVSETIPAIQAITPSDTDVYVGDTVTWSPSAVGGYGNLYYDYKLYSGDDNTDPIAEESGKANPFSRQMTESGSYTLTAQCRDANFLKSNIMTADTVHVYEKPKMNSVSQSIETGEVGDEVTWTASASGGIGSLSYIFKILKSGKEYQTIEQESESCVFVPQEPGVYSVSVTAADSRGTQSTSFGKGDFKANDHWWDQPVYTWGNNYNTVTASRTCKRNSEHQETETAAAVKTIAKSPTETEAGSFIAAAVFENSAYQVKPQSVTIPALQDMDTLILPEDAVIIGEQAFMNGAFEAVIIPEGCREIGAQAFANCENLKYVRIPSSVISVSADAFLGSGSVCLDDLRSQE